MSAFQPYRRPFSRVAPATLATFATVQGSEPESVANVASVASPEPETNASPAPNVANVASVAGPKPENGAAPIEGAASWRAALLGLSPDADPCPGFRPGTWIRVWANALDFLDRNGGEAEGLGWIAAELFGVHPTLGVVRVDHCGALMLSVAGRVLAVEANLIRYANGLAFRRSPGSGASVPVWAFNLAVDGLNLEGNPR